MDQAPKSRTDREKLSIFRACFTGLPNVFGTYDPQTGQVHQVKQPVTDKVLHNHLRGRQPYGVYLLVADRTRAVAVDFDEEDMGKPLRFVRQATHYGIHTYVERSKSKGWHAWIFMVPPGVVAAKARLVVKAILEDIGAPATEVFPKQDSLGEGVQYGNFINAPLFGSLVARQRSVFVDSEAGFKPYPNQWEVLANVQRVTDALLDEIIEMNDLQPDPAAPGTATGNRRPASSFHGLLPCARRMIAEGVKQYQRVSCFRLAIQLKKVGLPLESAVAVLVDWAGRNRPVSGKPVIGEVQVKEQAEWAYRRNYRSCGCEEPAVAPYCDPSCPLKRPRKDGPPAPSSASSAVSNTKEASDANSGRSGHDAV
ncbi:MAG: hypothetical protein NTX87_15545 [Planctomycetota bacterium]|nr:hypothetical protein [Planctomycetota bacterium]